MWAKVKSVLPAPFSPGCVCTWSVSLVVVLFFLGMVKLFDLFLEADLEGFSELVWLGLNAGMWTRSGVGKGSWE